MYSISTRLNSVFFYFVICIIILCAFNILTTIFHNQKPTVAKFEVTRFTSLYNHPYTKVQHSTGLVDIDIDFAPCFNWNSNLVFAWITATYKTGPKERETTVTVYDNIMLRTNTKSHMVSLKRRSFEYPLVDVYKTLEGKEVVFELHWEHMPVVGPILKV
jgi:signal peptidase complex subunit 3